VTALGLAELFAPSSGVGGPRLHPDEVERAFYDHGINAFLLSPSMKAATAGVRRLIAAGHRDELVLVSGCGVPLAGSVRRALEKQLRLAGTEYLDVWLLGWLRKRWYVRSAVWSAMRRLREEGKTRAIGFSSHDRSLAATLARELPADVIMIRYNASHRGAEREVFDALADMGAARPGIIAYTATRWGLLLRPLPERGFPTSMSGPECYRFALDHPMVDMVWCAARTRAELGEDVAGALAGPLDPERRREICRFGDAVHQAARGGARWMFGSASG
jgi:aryl-alcohol dehydrogenase-like predicted oxidoreductase